MTATAIPGVCVERISEATAASRPAKGRSWRAENNAAKTRDSHTTRLMPELSSAGACLTPASIDREGRAGDPACFCRCQEQNEAGDFFGCTDASKRVGCPGSFQKCFV